jgi:hypothetical protein
MEVCLHSFPIQHRLADELVIGAGAAPPLVVTPRLHITPHRSSIILCMQDESGSSQTILIGPCNFSLPVFAYCTANLTPLRHAV